MKTLLLIVVTIVLATVVAWLSGADPLSAGHWSGQAHETIRPWRTILIICRWGLWCGLWWRWERVGQQLFKTDTGTESITALHAQWSSMRNRMTGAIAVVEAIILLNTIMRS